MSSVELPRLGTKPFIALVDRANRALQVHMVREMHKRGYPKVKQAHNAVFGTLQSEGSRSADMAQQAGMTRQSMGELVREMVALGILEMRPDPEDGRAKLVTYTELGRQGASEGRRHLLDLEQAFVEEFGAEEYAAARDVLARVVDVLERWDQE